jgi:uncharacterized Rmd1/YagE family protein
MNLKVKSFQVADSIDIKSFKAAYAAKTNFADSDELFYQIETYKFLYVFKYGIVCFLGYDETEMSAFLQMISPNCKNFLEQKLSAHLLLQMTF